jgi:hypothetical protein
MACLSSIFREKRTIGRESSVTRKIALNHQYADEACEAIRLMGKQGWDEPNEQNIRCYARHKLFACVFEERAIVG